MSKFCKHLPDDRIDGNEQGIKPNRIVHKTIARFPIFYTDARP